MFWDNFGPFLASTEDLLVGLASDLTNPLLMFANFFLKLSQQDGGDNLLSCPDVLFHTGSDKMLPKRQEWIEMAKELQVQSISLDIGGHSYMTSWPPKGGGGSPKGDTSK